MQPERSASTRIENHLHFIWFGETLPDFAQIAIASSLEKNPGAQATLWMGEPLRNVSELADLRARGLRLALIEPAQLFVELQRKAPSLPTKELEAIYLALRKPAARANMIRMVVLYLHGGIYLDTDTLTVRDLSPLRVMGAFCGEEPTLWPEGTALLDPRAVLLGEIRRVCSLVPGGHRLHNRMLGKYTMSANNAVLGARSGHPFVAHLLRGAALVPESERLRRYRLGTHLLQKCLRDYEPPSKEADDQVNVMPTRHFYPLGPEISRHYFLRSSDPRAKSQEILSPETYVIHWYASVGDLVSRDADYILNTADQNVYSYLCRSHVTERAPVRVPRALTALA